MMHGLPNATGLHPYFYVFSFSFGRIRVKFLFSRCRLKKKLNKIFPFEFKVETKHILENFSF